MYTLCQTLSTQELRHLCLHIACDTVVGKMPISDHNAGSMGLHRYGSVPRLRTLSIAYLSFAGTAALLGVEDALSKHVTEDAFLVAHARKM